jgi:hypothetical protein
MGGVSVAGDLLLPTHGAVGLLTRVLAFLAIPVVLYGMRFAHEEELAQVRLLLARIRRGPRPPAEDAA